MANAFLTSDMMGRCAVHVYYDTDVEYACYAAPGSLTSAAVWAVSKTTYSNGKLVSVEWANGNTERDNIAANYATLTYS
jgi:hypothetical protein